MTPDGERRPAGSDPLTHAQRRARRPSGAEARLRRSAADRRIAGIAGGIAAFTGADSRLVRVVFVTSIPLSIGVTAIGYLLLWLLLPGDADPRGPDRHDSGRQGLA